MRQAASRSITVFALLSIFMGTANAAPTSSSAVVNSSDSSAKKIANCVLGLGGFCFINNPYSAPRVSPQQQYTDVYQEYQNEFNNFGNDKPTTNLTGTWIGKGGGFTIDERGCTAGYTGTLTFNGQDERGDVKSRMEQRGNQLIIPDAVVNYSVGGGGSYITHSQGKISNDRIIILSSANAPFGSLIIKSIGTVTKDGIKINSKVTCNTSRGPSADTIDSTSTRLTPTPYPYALGTPDYYQFRNDDFKRRNPDLEAPHYYLDFGKRNLEKYLNETYYKLTQTGKDFLDKVKVSLQRKMEDKLISDPLAFAELERNDEEFREFAYETHIPVYCESGWGELPLSDNREIAWTILSDLKTGDLKKVWQNWDTQTAYSISKNCGFGKTIGDLLNSLNKRFFP